MLALSSIDTAPNGASDVSLFLNFLYENAPLESYVSLLTIKKDTKQTEYFTHKVTNLSLIEHKILSREDNYNIFVRVTALKYRPIKGRGTAELASGSQVLWCDIDSSDFTKVITTLQQLTTPPTLIINSGHGIHAYWKLRQFETDLAIIRSKNKALQHQINQLLGTQDADSVFDLARVMRVPGTWNVKNGQPKPVTIVSYELINTYDITQFIDAPINETPPVAEWEPDDLPVDFLDQLAIRDKKLVARITSEDTALKAGAHKKSDGTFDHSRNDIFVANRLIGLEYPPGCVIAVLMHDEWVTGAKYRETLRFDYVIRTADSAWHNHLKSPEAYFSGKTFKPTAMVDRVRRKQTFLYAASMLYRYADGVFKDDGEHYVQSFVIEKLGKRWRSVYGDETVILVKHISNTPLDTIIEKMKRYRGFINVSNGMLDVNTNELLPHDSEYLSLNQINVKYDYNVDTTEIDNFVAAIIPVDAVALFWEFVGSAFIRDYYWPKAFVALVGLSDSGKSKLLGVLMHFFGSTNTASMSFQMLADNRFAESYLFGRLVNIFNDLDESEAQNTGKIKGLTGDDTLTAERKFQTPFQFKNTARLMFSSNHYPTVKNADDAYFNRAYIIPCNNVFIAGETADENIADKMTTPENLSAILIRAVQGLQRLLEQRKFSPSKSVQEAMQEYRYSADTISGFINAQTVPDITAFVPKPEMYRRYVNWCANGGRKPFGEDRFYKRMVENFKRFDMDHEFRTDPKTGNRQWVYTGRKVLPLNRVIIPNE